MGMSLAEYNARALREAEQRRDRDGREADDRAIEDYMSLAPHTPRAQELNRVIAMLSMI
jgi:hypothetical protein